jgi:outer membrane protein assembly factor BamA
MAKNLIRRRLGGWLALAFACLLAVPLWAKEDVAKLEISGLGWLADREMRVSLERLLGEERGPRLDANAIEDAMFLLMSAVQDQGFLKPVIHIDLTDENGAHTELALDASMNVTVPRTAWARAVHFKVDRGVRYFIEAVKFTGLSVLPEETARAFFIGQSALFATKANRAFTPSRVARGVDSLASELRQRGYAESDVRTEETQIDDRTGAVRLAIGVTEGVRWQVASVTLDVAGRPDAAPPAVQRFVGLPWSESLQQDVATEVRKGFLASGHPDVRVSLSHDQAKAPDGGKDVVLAVHVQPGEAVTMGEPRFEGAGDVRPAVIRRRLHATAGQPLNMLELEQARYRISRLGVFDRVNLRLEPDEGSVRSPVFALQPGRRMEVNLLAGYGSYEQLRAGVEFRQYNVFGLAHQMRGQLVESMKSTRGEYSYTVPELFGESVDGTAKVFGLQREEVAFERQEYGLTVALAAPLAFIGANATAGYTFQALRNRNNRLETQAIDDKQVTVASVDGGLTRDRRDNPLMPRHGYRWFAQVEAASRALGGEAEYQRSEFGGSYHTAWGDGRWVHLNAAHGVITTWGTTDELLPVNKRFFPGGDGSIRGYRTGEASPRGADGKFVGAKSYLSGSVELEQALARKWSAVAFVDAIGTATQLRHYPFDETLFAAGLGLRYQTLIGPIRVEYGRNLKRRIGDPGGTLLFSVGVPF